MGTFTLSLQKSEKDNDYQNEILRSTINMCKLEDGVRGNFLTKMLMENFYNSSDFSLKCPMKPRTFSLWNFKMSANAFPSYLLTNDFKFMIDLKIQSKIPSVKGLVYFQTLKFFGEVKKWYNKVVRVSLVLVTGRWFFNVKPFAKNYDIKKSRENPSKLSKSQLDWKQTMNNGWQVVSRAFKNEILTKPTI